MPLMALLVGFFCKSERKKKFFTPTITVFFTHYRQLKEKKNMFIVPSEFVTSELQSLLDEAGLRNTI